jgi:hypothetical protein
MWLNAFGAFDHVGFFWVFGTWRSRLGMINEKLEAPLCSPSPPAIRQWGGFDIKKLPIVARDYHTDEHVVGYYNTGDRMAYWGKQGAFCGGLGGLFFGSAFFFIPGIGPLVVAEPLVSWIVGALEGTAVVGGLSILGAALYGMRMPSRLLASSVEGVCRSELIPQHSRD